MVDVLPDVTETVEAVSVTSANEEVKSEDWEFRQVGSYTTMKGAAASDSNAYWPLAPVSSV
jgi:hypothetical protein